ncbi:diguanylate cyclase [Marinospirillum sp.]|uniref:diguanylate cyclase n=1 Tax=Marinospirillum sp. TaxID=2183934 RepID=UPI00384E0D1F
MRQLLIKTLLSPWALLIPLPFWAAVVGLIHLNSHQLIESAGYEMARQRGEVAFNLVQAMRHWNTEHGGVYAPLTERTPENPYLETPEKTITSPKGVDLTKLNPAYMTRQLGEIMQGSDLEINLTSERLMNPDNKPDAWESEALQTLGQDDSQEQVEIVGDRFRYMAPLYMEEGCMSCHAKMGYEVGDLRGGLSVSFPASYVERLTTSLHRESLLTHLLAFLLLSATGSLAIFGLGRLLKSLNTERSQRESIINERTASLSEEITRRRASQDQLQYLAHHDELTGARNRRWILQQLKDLLPVYSKQSDHLAVMLLDIDHFKKINDTYGHDAGDEVLKGFVKTLQNCLRESDLLGRYGGEEFLVLVPHSNEQTAIQVAERLREAVAQATYFSQAGNLNITASIGITLTSTQPTTSEELVNQADTALYQAKTAGRNRSVIWKD